MSQSAPRAVVLAAGKGTRMNSDLPKVLHNLAGHSLLCHVLQNLHKAGIERPIVVVGHKAELVKETIQKEVDFPIEFCLQTEQNGTGHAVQMAEPLLRNFDGSVLIACGDVPLMQPESYSNLLKAQQSDGATLSVLSMKLDDPGKYGRIVRDDSGQLKNIIEFKDASDDVRAINEVNTGTYAVDSKQLFSALKNINNNNAAGEYYLPDIVGIYAKDNLAMNVAVLADPTESLGINTQEELANIEKLVQENQAWTAWID